MASRRRAGAEPVADGITKRATLTWGPPRPILAAPSPPYALEGGVYEPSHATSVHGAHGGRGHRPHRHPAHPVTNDLIRGDIYYWGSLMAGAVLGSVPIVAIYVFFLDYYVSGLTAGAVK